MTALLVVLMLVGFAVIDLLVRAIGRRMREARVRKEREAVLNVAVRTDYTAEATTLKRVEVPNAKARILAVDDEPVVLDSFRRILVLEGYSVDTVEKGPEALGLVQRNDYDFVFTDLKMPDMDGTEVVKSVKHLRPDVDVAVITGYGTIETAVDTMQHGAVAYVQKPFTAEELSEFARQLLIKRQARLEANRRPSVRIVAPAVAETAAAKEFCVPGGAFVSDGHTWARIEANGLVRIGLDDFARKALIPIDNVAPPKKGETVRRGGSLFAIGGGGKVAHFVAPVGGRVAQINERLLDHPAHVGESPYDRGWVCLVEPFDLASDLSSMRIGKAVVDWYQTEIERLSKAGAGAAADAGEIDWNRFESQFLTGAAASHG